jgi:hypothetical protein
MNRNSLCKKCGKEIMEQAQKHGFVCKAKKDIYGAGRFCAYAARDYRGKKEGLVGWQAFPVSDVVKKAEQKAVALQSSWTKILDVAGPEERRQRWEEWKRLALAAGEKGLVDLWTDTEACLGCKHRNRDWCLRTELPCAVNPFLTLKTGMTGMACMGMGRDDGINQGELFGELF